MHRQQQGVGFPCMPFDASKGLLTIGVVLGPSMGYRERWGPFDLAKTMSGFVAACVVRPSFGDRGTAFVSHMPIWPRVVTEVEGREQILASISARVGTWNAGGPVGTYMHRVRSGEGYFPVELVLMRRDLPGKPGRSPGVGHWHRKRTEEGLAGSSSANGSASRFSIWQLDPCFGEIRRPVLELARSRPRLVSTLVS